MDLDLIWIGLDLVYKIQIGFIKNMDLGLKSNPN